MNPIKLRVYVKENIEVYEVLHAEKKELINRYTYPLGSTFVDYIYSDKDKFFDDMGRTNLLLREISDNDYAALDIGNMPEEEKKDFIKAYRSKHDVTAEIQELEKISIALPNNHIFYYIYSIYLNDMLTNYLENKKRINNYKFFAHDRFIASQARELIKKFIDSCLDISISKKVSIGDRFSDMLNKYNKQNTNNLKICIPESEYEFYPERKYNYNGFENKKSELCQVIYPKTIEDIVYFLMVQQIKNETRYNECKNCGKYFVLSGHKSMEYCERPIDGSDKTCKDIGAMTSYRKKKDQDPIYREYNKAYKTKNARIRYGLITREQFQVWSKNARIMREKCRNGEITLDQYAQWLKSDNGFRNILDAY